MNDLRKAAEAAIKALLLRRNQTASPEADDAARDLRAALADNPPDDAQRFRWIAEHALAVDFVADPDGLVKVWSRTDGKLVYEGRTLREAVDAAMKDKPENS